MSRQNTAAFKIIDGFAHLLALCIGNDQLCLSALRGTKLRRLIDIAIGMTRDGDRLFPVFDHGADAVYEDRRAEHCAVENCANRSVRAFPHLMQVIFAHALCVRRDGGALHADTVFFDCFCRIVRHGVACAVTLGQPKIIVFGFQLHEGEEQLVLDLFPKDAGHLVAVHFNQRCCHFNSVHLYSPD